MDGIPAASQSPINPPAIPNGDSLGSVLATVTFHFLVMIGFAAVLILVGLYSCDIEDRRHRPRRPGKAGIALEPSPEERRIKEVAAGCTECAICLGEYSADGEGVRRRTLRPCGHRFHEHFIDAWLSMKPRGCPTCRGVLRGNSLSVHHIVNVNGP